MDPDRNTTTITPAPGLEIRFLIKPVGKKLEVGEKAFISRVVDWKGVTRNGQPLGCNDKTKSWFYRRHGELCNRLLSSEHNVPPAAQPSSKSPKAKEEKKE